MIHLQLKKLYPLCLLLSLLLIGASPAAAQKPRVQKTRPATVPAKPAAPENAAARTEPARIVRSSVQRIGIVSPKADLSEVSGTAASDAVQNTFYELLKSKTVDVVAIEARLPIQVMPEAVEKGIQYILYSTLSQKKGKSDGGMFGRMTGRVANKIGSRIPYGNGVGEEIVSTVASETLMTVSSLATTIKAKDEVTLEYKLVRVGDSKAVVSNSMTAKAKENGEDIITGMIETAANEVLTNVISGSGSVAAGNVPPTAATAKTVAQTPAKAELVPFIKVMSEAFARDYVGRTIKTKVRFVAAGQTQNWVFGSIPANVMKDKMAFRVFDEATNNSEATMGSVLPHIFVDKATADFIFGLKKGEELILTGSPVVGSISMGSGGNYTQIIFVANSVEKSK